MKKTIIIVSVLTLGAIAVALYQDLFMQNQIKSIAVIGTSAEASLERDVLAVNLSMDNNFGQDSFLKGSNVLLLLERSATPEQIDYDLIQGFEQFVSLDSNKDGEINASDAFFQRLSFLSVDPTTHARKITSLQQSGVQAILLNKLAIAQALRQEPKALGSIVGAVVMSDGTHLPIKFIRVKAKNLV